jgi:streptomycin 3"-adenylyltransferase
MPIPPVIAALLPDLVADLEQTLGGDLAAVWLYGSAVTGGFDAGSSDLDLVIVTEADVGTIDLARLNAIHGRLAAREPDWADRLDLAYVSRSTLAAFRWGGLVASISHDDPLQLYDEADEWLQTWYLARETGLAVVGPAPRNVIPPISSKAFVRAVVRSSLELADRARGDARDGWRAYTLLTLCRVLASMATGSIVSKQQAAAAVERRRPELRPAVEAALAFRAGRGRVPTADADRPRILAAIEALASEVRAGQEAAGRRGTGQAGTRAVS